MNGAVTVGQVVWVLVGVGIYRAVKWWVVNVHRPSRDREAALRDAIDEASRRRPR